MRWTLVLTCLVLATASAAAQYRHPDAHRAYVEHWRAHPEHAEALARGWHDRLFHRPIGAPLLARWTADLRAGIAPLVALGNILAGPEFYLQVGSSPAGWVQQTFVQIVGRAPTPAEYQFWLSRLYHTDRAIVAQELIARYPPAWATQGVPVAPVVVDPYEYRRPVVIYR